MLLKILILIFLLLLISLLIYFLMAVFVPAVQNQTENNDNILLSKFEHQFNKLSNRASYEPIKERAFVFCKEEENFNHKVNITPFKGQTCKLVQKYFESVNECNYSCIGMGDCVKQCSQQAISIINKTAVISNLCVGCGKCVGFCPSKIIRLVKVDEKDSSKGINSKDFSELIFSDQNIQWKKKKVFNFWTFCYKLIKPNK